MFKHFGMVADENDLLTMSVMMGKSESMQALKSEVGTGSREHVFEGDSIIIFLTFS